MSPPHPHRDAEPPTSATSCATEPQQSPPHDRKPRKKRWRTKWRKWNNILHRDIGYFFSGTMILYAISGLAVNHIADWDPNFIIDRQTIHVDLPEETSAIDRPAVMNVLDPLNEASNYRSFDFPSPSKLKIYLTNGSVFINLKDGVGEYETVRRRPLFYRANTLHLNPKRWWLVFSDLFAVGLIVIGVTGLFVLKGKNGITGRGAILAGAGVVIPLIFLFAV